MKPEFNFIRYNEGKEKLSSLFSLQGKGNIAVPVSISSPFFLLEYNETLL
jgi:hypothetical protein